MAQQEAKQKYTPAFHECVVPGQLQRQQSTGLSFHQDLDTDEVLEVTQVPGPRIRLLNDHVITSVGQPTTLECQVPEWSSDREGFVDWVHSGEVCNGERYLSLRDAGLFYLFIKDTIAEDGGVYTVVARIGAARSEREMNVRVALQHPPLSEHNYLCVLCSICCFVRVL